MLHDGVLLIHVEANSERFDSSVDIELGWSPKLVTDSWVSKLINSCCLF